MEIPAAIASCSPLTAGAGAVTNAGGRNNAEFWDPISELLLTMVARKYKYDWVRIGDFLTSAFAEVGLVFTFTECELQFRKILATAGSGEILFPSPPSSITRLLVAQLYLLKNVYKDLQSEQIPPEVFTRHFEDLIKAGELSEKENESDGGSELGEGNLDKIILEAIPTDEEDLDDPDPTIRRMRRIRKKVRLEVRNGQPANYDGEISDLEEDEDEPLREVFEKWGRGDTSTADAMDSIDMASPVTSTSAAIAQSDSQSTYYSTDSSAEKNKIIARILLGLFDESENTNTQDNGSVQAAFNNQSSSALSCPGQMYTETGEGVELPEPHAGCLEIKGEAGPYPDIPLDLEIQQYNLTLDLGQPTPADVDAKAPGDIDMSQNSTETFSDPTETVTPMSLAPLAPRSTDPATTRGLILLHERVERNKSAHMFGLPTKNSRKGDIYYKMIINPISLKTIRVDIKKGVIGNIDEYESSVYFMYLNAIMMNRTDLETMQCIKMMQDETSRIIAEYRTTQELIEERKKAEDRDQVSVDDGNSAKRKRKTVSAKDGEDGGGEKTVTVQGPKKKKSRKVKKSGGDEEETGAIDDRTNVGGGETLAGIEEPYAGSEETYTGFQETGTKDEETDIGLEETYKGFGETDTGGEEETYTGFEETDTEGY